MERTATVRHEYVGGMIHAQAGATKEHVPTAGNIFAGL